MLILVHSQALIQWILMTLTVVVVVWAAVKAQWRSLMSTSIRLHLFMALVFALGIFWPIVSIRLNDIFLIHPSLIPSVVLIFGFRFGLLLGAASVAIAHLVSGLYWQNYGFHFTVGVLCPSLITLAALHIVKRIRLKILFFYTLGAGFAGGIFSMLAMGAVSTALLWAFNPSLFWPLKDHFYLFALLAFPEGFCNGVIVSSLTILRPDLMKTFDEDFYLN